MNPEQADRLIDAATQVSRHSHCPFSQFPVGAALLTSDGSVHAGCNVESVSFGLTCCAERSALFTAIAAGVQPGEITAMAIYTPGDRTYTSCGACRQVMSELMPADATVISACDSDTRISLTIDEFLPQPFRLDP